MTQDERITALEQALKEKDEQLEDKTKQLEQHEEVLEVFQARIFQVTALEQALGEDNHELDIARQTVGEAKEQIFQVWAKTRNAEGSQGAKRRTDDIDDGGANKKAKTGE